MKTRTVSSPTVQAARTKPSATENIEQAKEKLKLLEQRERLTKGLPHLYAFDLYKWQRDYINSRNKMNFLCAANQIGKSVCNFIKMVEWATNKPLWPKLWKKKPTQFWFVTIDRNFILREWRDKWSKLLPQGEFQNHPQYGWKAEFRNKFLHAIHFNSGVICYFNTFEMDINALQGSTIDALFLDEEMPWSMMPELLLRIGRKDGYLCAVMTPTKGQDEWRCVFEERGHKERFPEAFKLQVSVYDCMETETGQPGLTQEYVTKLINRLGSQSEIDLRVYGKFSVHEGLKLDAFSRIKNIRPPDDVPKDWHLYSGVDLGGGEGGSLAAISFVAVRPDYQFARVIESWRGKDDETTTVLDVFDRYVMMRAQRRMYGEFYDYAAKDFKTLGDRAGFSFIPAEKKHQIGFPLLNSLFKNQMLVIDDTTQNYDLISEILTLRWDVNKKDADDDAVDALRYAVTKIPWSMDGIVGERVIEMPQKLEVGRPLRVGFKEVEPDSWSMDDEIAEWNEENDF